MKICLIPARGGSKRIKKKNIKDFWGKPIINWSISAAIESKIFDRILVSTDDETIAKISIDAGAEIPFLRTEELSGDNVSTIDVVRDTIDRLDGVDTICCLYATAPFVTADDLILSHEMLYEGPDFVIPVTTYCSPIERSLIIKGNELKMRYPEFYAQRSQDLQATYHDAGMFYWGKSKAWKDFNNPYESIVKPYIIDRRRVCDIDDLEDWEHAELMFHALRAKED